MPTKRLRIFAGPNGSGKSTIFKAVSGYFHCDYFVNADEIQKQLRTKGFLNFDAYTILIDRESFVQAFAASGLFDRMQFGKQIIEEFKIVRNRLEIPEIYVDAYVAAFIAEYIRINMLNVVPQFTIETVLSDARKIDYIRQVKALGYRIYLYFVATKDVAINIGRVRQRVKLDGHDVAEDKIRSRYEKSLNNAFDVLMLCDRAYFFDNSTETWEMIAEYDDEGRLELQKEIVPGWFSDSILKKIKKG